MSTLASRLILGMRVDATSIPAATEQICTWARRGGSYTVGIATVHNVMESYDDPAYLEVMNDADLVTPDGMPLVWGLKLLGVPDATRVYGPSLTPALCARAAAEGIPVGFYGGAPDVLDAVTARLRARFEGLQIAYAFSPPFRPPTAEEQGRVIDEVNASGARILFVGLGAPKQERWMYDHRGKIDAVMVGVGAAFDFIAGAKRQAPAWMQGAGLEWLFRLTHEPGRLWKRYAKHNPRFVALFGAQVARERAARHTDKGDRR